MRTSVIDFYKEIYGTESRDCFTTIDLLSFAEAYTMTVVGRVRLSQAVAYEFGLTENEMLMKSQSGDKVYARQMYALLIYENITENHRIIGDHIGLNRATIYHSIENIRNLIEIEMNMNLIYKRLSSQISSGRILMPTHIKPFKILAGGGNEYGQETR